MNWENLAKAGYELYRYQMVGSGHGDGIEPWDGLPLAERMAWISATKEICDIFAKAVTA